MKVFQIDGLKRAIVATYFLDHKDREWILSNFSEEENKLINNKINELAEIGITRNEESKRLVFSLLSPSSEDSLHDLIKLLKDSRPRILIRFFNEEAPWVKALLIERYPLLLDAGFISKLENSKKDRFCGRGDKMFYKLTEKATNEILRIISDNLKKLCSFTDDNNNSFSKVLHNCFKESF